MATLAGALEQRQHIFRERRRLCLGRRGYGRGTTDDTRQRKQTDNGDDSLHNCLRYLARVLRTRGAILDE